MRVTEKEKNFYNILKEFIKENKYTPTIRELGKLLGFSSPATTYYYLEQLEKKGLIKRISNRNIKIIGGSI